MGGVDLYSIVTRKLKSYMKDDDDDDGDDVAVTTASWRSSVKWRRLIGAVTSCRWSSTDTVSCVKTSRSTPTNSCRRWYDAGRRPRLKTVPTAGSPGIKPPYVSSPRCRLVDSDVKFHEFFCPEKYFMKYFMKYFWNISKILRCFFSRFTLTRLKFFFIRQTLSFIDLCILQLPKPICRPIDTCLVCLFKYWRHFTP